METNYTEDNIKTLDWKEHIRKRPGMYIGKLGNGTAPDDGIYILSKEIMDNAVDEYLMGNGRKIEIKLDKKRITIRDYGRGIPLGKVVDCFSKINTGGKYDSEAFQKSVGLNGVGAKATNALSKYLKVQSFRNGECKMAEFQFGELTNEMPISPTKESNGTLVIFEPDETIFEDYNFNPAFLEELMWNYAYLNAGLKLYFNGKEYFSKNGLLDLLRNKTNEEELCYPIVHFKGEDFEVAITHGKQYGEEYYSFVNGQHTTQGGTHLAAFREAIVKTVRDFYKKDYDPADVRASIVAAVSIRIQEPVFESQTKTKLGSQYITPNGGTTIRSLVMDFMKEHFDKYLHMNTSVKDALQKKILQSEKERKEISGIRKLANEKAKKANLHNKKLRDCQTHFTDLRKEKRYETTIFITEGDSASGSITKARQVETQAVFSLRGKPLNCYGMTKKVVYQNEEFNLLQHALDIENGVENVRYNKVVIATDADVDGAHIRLLLLTFFLQFFPDLVKQGHLYILETPLFRVRNKKDTIYCYDEKEKQKAITKLGPDTEITRFKGLGEISPDEFSKFIGKDIRLEPVLMKKETQISKILDYYMGKNTPDRQTFIVDNLRPEEVDRVEN
ncbi:MAG: type IIA DNA topoisomerase subunit B [Cytophagia bacterium]|nr:MAG: type IIA DNA topoisomerase subunit B [Cytophagales bacterium]TAF98950.1 MAG: type IIA DNA topoisomerase subunit B [Cytophagia bacterium]TAG45863.1 MAG: type IIA DNA topoisomerase subunit B [Cytophagia bacterium]TAH31330.1 MAG: type IIA DNA topoisomerase subunit B [Cytophagales bacterium]